VCVLFGFVLFVCVYVCVFVCACVYVCVFVCALGGVTIQVESVLISSHQSTQVGKRRPPN